jgi:hypothetical protein
LCSIFSISEGVIHSESLPPLDPGTLPKAYLNLDRNAKSSSNGDPEIEKAQKAVTFSAPQPPAAPAELLKTGKPLTKKERKAVSTSEFLTLAGLY